MDTLEQLEIDTTLAMVEMGMVTEMTMAVSSSGRGRANSSPTPAATTQRKFTTCLSHLLSLFFTNDVFLANEQHMVLEEEARLEENGLHLSTEKMEYMECGPQTDGTIRHRQSGPEESAMIQIPRLCHLQRRRVLRLRTKETMDGQDCKDEKERADFFLETKSVISKLNLNAALDLVGVQSLCLTLWKEKNPFKTSCKNLTANSLEMKGMKFDPRLFVFLNWTKKCLKCGNTAGYYSKLWKHMGLRAPA